MLPTCPAGSFLHSAPMSCARAARGLMEQAAGQLADAAAPAEALATEEATGRGFIFRCNRVPIAVGDCRDRPGHCADETAWLEEAA